MKKATIRKKEQVMKGGLGSGAVFLSRQGGSVIRALLSWGALVGC